MTLTNDQLRLLGAICDQWISGDTSATPDEDERVQVATLIRDRAKELSW